MCGCLQRWFVMLASIVFFASVSEREVLAWSLETHLYIGNRVLEDALDDGAISLCVGAVSNGSIDCSRPYPLPPAAAAALRDHPDAYLAGVLGPDAFPDFITAQVTVHPGLDNGWQTDDWLAHILRAASSPEEIAWAFGYVAHAASDIFAHTWVNHYAGDIFDLSKHEGNGNEVELRHFTLERYIADRTPRIWESLGGWRAPHAFVADQLILANAAAAQYQRSGLPAHLVAVESLHETVGNVHDEAKRLETRINELALKELSPLRGAERTLEQAKQGLQAAQEGLKLAQGALGLRDQLLGDLDRKRLELAAIIENTPGQINEWRRQIDVHRGTIEVTQSGLAALEDGVAGARGALDRARDILNNTAETITDTVCEFVGGVFGELGKTICNTVARTNPAWVVAKTNVDAASKALADAEDALRGAQELIGNLGRAIADLEDQIDRGLKAIEEARPLQRLVELDIEANRKLRELELKTVQEAERAVVAAQAEVDKALAEVRRLGDELKPVAELLASYSPIVLLLGHWRDDIRRASIAFSKTSQTVAERIVAKSGGERMGAYLDWLECWGPVLVAIPSEATQTICVARDEYLALKGRLEGEIDRIVNELGGLGWLLAPGVKLRQEFDKKVRKPLEQDVRRQLGKVRDEVIAFATNPDFAQLVALMDSGERVTDDALAGVFATDDTGQDLLEIADIASRVRRDTGLESEGGQVSEQSFAALYNAITLSKLSLLDVLGLNTVHEALTGRKASSFGEGLYRETGGPAFTLLLEAVRSIDGNHQWQRVALPYPRARGHDEEWPGKRRYGRPHPQGHSAFRIWGDPVARETIFKAIFRGPLNPGLEDHPAIVANYPFPACLENPFPSTTDANGADTRRDASCALARESKVSELPGRFGVLSNRLVARRELNGLSLWELRVARNEIFARHGYPFGPAELKAYFAGQSWYRRSGLPPGEINARLTSLEWQNAATIRRLEHGRLGKPAQAPGAFAPLTASR